jgi:ribosomal protein S18 acetylase RimI-like enzyme
MSLLQWTPLTEADLPELVALARDCLAEDGGLPELSSESMLRSFFLSLHGVGGRDTTGDLVAAGGVCVDGHAHCGTGLVLPSLRRQGIGAELVRWCREASPTVTHARIENVTPLTESVMAEAGMRRTFAETVMRHSLRHVPFVPAGEGLERRAFTEADAALFHEAYRRSFGDRPGFPDTPLEEWTEDLVSDPAFRPELSRVLVDEGPGPVAFVTLSDGWIDQVGVDPAWRGRRLGAHLVARSLTALQGAGSAKVWLCVNVDNPAQNLYERLGFKRRGTRARYADARD